MILGINPRCDSGPIRVRFVFPRDVGLQDPSQFSLGVNGAVLVEVVVPNVFCGVLHLVINKR